MEEVNAEIQKMEQLNVTLIISMKGPSLSNNHKIAHELAKTYKYPLIDENDITRSLKSIRNRLTERLTFEVLQRVASTQLSLQISVIINTTLSDHAHIYELKKLASSKSARLIIIECDAQGQYKVYDETSDAVKLSVDEKSSSGEHSGELLETVRDEQLQVYPSSNVLLQSSPSVPGKVLKASKVKRPINDHLHALTLSAKPKKDTLVCKKCSKLISDQNYHCNECDEFILHKSCAETPNKVQALAQDCPQYLREISPNYDFSQKNECSNCDEFSTDCYDCLLETNLHCGFLPPIFHHKRHKHPLNFTIIPHGFHYQYLCCACGRLGRSISYKCYVCNYDLHINCVLLPSTVAFKSDKHQLSFSQEDSGEFSCDICREKGDKNQWYFQCADCKIAVHVKCMPDLKNSKTTY